MRSLSRVVAKAILFDENDNILLIRRSKTDQRRPLQWDTPGGAVDEGEDYITATIREVAEEVGIAINEESLHVVYSTSEMTEKGNVVWIYFVTRVQKTEPVLSSEHDTYKWIPFTEVSETIEYDRQLKAFEYIKTNNLLPPS